MSESRHDSPFANSGLVSPSSPRETGSTHPLAGVHYQQRVERLAYLADGPNIQGTDPVGPRLSCRAGPAAARFPPAIAGAGKPIDLGLFLPEPVSRHWSNGLPMMDRRFGGRFLRDATLTGPEVARQLARSHHPRPGKPAEPGRSPGFIPAAKGPATPAESSARPSMGCGRRG